jgi:hypothetical protein
VAIPGLGAEALAKLIARLALALGAAFVVVDFVAVFIPFASAAAGVLSFAREPIDP